MNLFNIKKAFAAKKEKGWEKLYFCIDVHDTIIPSGTENTDFYPVAQEVLKSLSDRADIVLILWSSSHMSLIASGMNWLASHGINIDYVNCNPEVGHSDRCDFSQKFYMNVILDDRAGFEGATDWALIKQELIDIGEWN